MGGAGYGQMGVCVCACNGNSWLNKTSYLPPHGIKFPEAFGKTRVLAWAGKWGSLMGVSGACPAAPGAGIWLKTKVKACLISPVKALITNKHRRGLGNSPV